MKKRMPTHASSEERKRYLQKQVFAGAAAAAVHLTKRGQSVKVTLPKLKFMEKENV